MQDPSHGSTQLGITVECIGCRQRRIVWARDGSPYSRLPLRRRDRVPR